MRAPTTTVVSLATSLAIATFSRAAGAVDVSSCAEFEAVDRAVESEITITTADFACDAYTRLSIRSNMVIKSAVGAVTFSNLSLKVYGSLTVEPDVMFTGITNAVSYCSSQVQQGALLELPYHTQLVCGSCTWTNYSSTDTACCSSRSSTAVY